MPDKVEWKEEFALGQLFSRRVPYKHVGPRAARMRIHVLQPWDRHVYLSEFRMRFILYLVNAARNGIMSSRKREIKRVLEKRE